MRPRSGFERIIAAVPKTDHSSVAADNEKHLAELEFISSMRGCLTDFAANKRRGIPGSEERDPEIPRSVRKRDVN